MYALSVKLQLRDGRTDGQTVRVLDGVWHLTVIIGLLSVSINCSCVTEFVTAINVITHQSTCSFSRTCKVLRVARYEAASRGVTAARVKCRRRTSQQTTSVPGTKDGVLWAHVKWPKLTAFDMLRHTHAYRCLQPALFIITHSFLYCDVTGQTTYLTGCIFDHIENKPLL